MYVIGLTGKAGSGKNLVAGFLASALCDAGYAVALDSFSKPLKDHLWTEHHLHKGNPIWRAQMQQHGDREREANPRHFVDALEARHHGDLATILIVTDVRYDNEATWCLEPGEIWRIGGAGALQGSEAGHRSEQGLPDEMVTVHVANVGHVLDLKSDVEMFARGVIDTLRRGGVRGRGKQE